MNFSDVQNIVYLLSLFIVPVTHFLYNLLLQRMTTQRASQVQNLAGIVVHSVEQQMLGQPGPDKKHAAEDTLNSLIKDFGLGRYASPTLVNAVIECAVQVMNSAASSAPAQSQDEQAESVPVPAQANDGAL